ncbi:MAG: 3-oxoacyl-ACP reductase [Deltaproteobacteria bacterium]|nr:3-oxoacyl-ACP reductase [Deltaproteobacteria bacterium]|tara:strand:- start:61 stop:813 length:753 start_codon:yes stop_codon:yes gene_type:complete
MNQIDLKNRNAVITGGAQGIGLAIAERLLDSGASVSLWDCDESLLKETSNSLSTKGTVQPVTMDVTDLESVRNAAKTTEESLGAIEILVCNAGIAGQNAKIWEYPPKEWQQVIDIDLTGVFNCLHIVSQLMIDQKYGRIVNVASVAGKEGNPNAAPYSAAKAGVIALTKSLGKELAGYDISVNCITPAAAKTRIFDQMSEDHIQYMLSKIPRNRFLKVEEAASMVAWLCSEDNSFTTGGVFDLSGGRSTY